MPEILYGQKESALLSYLTEKERWSDSESRNVVDSRELTYYIIFSMLISKMS